MNINFFDMLINIFLKHKDFKYTHYNALKESKSTRVEKI
jgi:hypothetical protein